MNALVEVPPDYGRHRKFEIPDERNRERVVEQTSINAFTENLDKLTQRETLIYNTMRRMHAEGRVNMTDQEIKAYLNQQDPNYVRPRRRDLVLKRGLVVCDIVRRCGVTGSTVKAWKIRVKE